MKSIKINHSNEIIEVKEQEQSSTQNNWKINFQSNVLNPSENKNIYQLHDNYHHHIV